MNLIKFFSNKDLVVVLFLFLSWEDINQELIESLPFYKYGFYDLDPKHCKKC